MFTLIIAKRLYLLFMAKYTKINLLIRSLRIFDSRAWPSGKAPGFGPGIRGFESLRPSHIERSLATSFTAPL